MNRNTPNYNPNRDLFTTFKQIIKDYLNDYLFTATPATVQAVNGDGTVNLLPVIQEKTTDGTALEITDNDLITNIKVLYFVGGGCEISFEAGVGDFGLLIACKADITTYTQTHTTSMAPSTRRFSLSNGLFLPLDFFDTSKTQITISRQAGNSSIVLNDNGITINTDGNIVANASSATVTATKNVVLNASRAIINSTAISLGGIGVADKGVARVGDEVEVKITSGSSTGTWRGTITKGSTMVKAG